MASRRETDFTTRKHSLRTRKHHNRNCCRNSRRNHNWSRPSLRRSMPACLAAPLETPHRRRSRRNRRTRNRRTRNRRRR